jgi:NAD(P)-dependent dehydrogenase (short-subunit alcohol dehydrogenase family)
MNCEGKVALVAGGASGLGAATVEALTDAGATVVVLDITVPEPGAGYGDTHYRAADVRDSEQVAAAIEYAAGLGDLRIVACCAGVGSVGRITRKGQPLDLDEFQRVIDINLVGTLNVLRLAATRMVENEPLEDERGVLIVTASAAAFEGQIGQVAYAASKGGIVGMTLPIARDLAAAKVRCVAIAPGLFDTPLLGALPEAARKAIEETIPNPSRLGRPSEFGQLMRQIVENPMINGETLRIDGALRMAPR